MDYAAVCCILACQRWHSVETETRYLNRMMTQPQNRSFPISEHAQALTEFNLGPIAV